MIINTSSLSMNSQRGYESKRLTGGESKTWGPKGFFSNTFLEKEENSAYENYSNRNSQLKEDNSLFLQETTTKRASEVKKLQEVSDKQSMRNQIIQYLLRLLLGEESDEYKNIVEENSKTIQETGGESTFFSSYSESEKTTFSTEGMVKTADGREINFQVDVVMSRSFSSYIEQNKSYGAQYTCIDPLVINTGSTIANVGNQTFYFDLDCDGKEDEISTLKSGSGFLALDKNGDGIINDGSELFGTTSGDGFDDLSAYDLDKNGWIDEADDIFSKLKIWYADGSEEAKLLSLKEAGVGAICLENAPTNFSLNNANNTTNAFIRKSGIFLYENGGVGTIQHVDMVKN